MKTIQETISNPAHAITPERGLTQNPVACQTRVNSKGTEKFTAADANQ